MYSIILLSPLFACAISFFFTYFFSPVGKNKVLNPSGFAVSVIVVFSTFVSFVFSVDLFFFIVNNSFPIYSVDIFSLINSNFFNASFGLYADTFSSIIFLLISTISLLVQIYSIGYMGEDSDFPRFMTYLSFFVFAMLLMVTSNNFFQFFFGWEFVGLASFLLISFWYARPEAASAAFKAMAYNRVGDVFLLFAFGSFIIQYGTLNFDFIFSCINFKTTYFTIFSLFCLTVGACAKSAQFLFHSWLPDAMEGPTPVSSLLHSATMVTAGVFLVLRCSPIYDQFPYFQAFLILIGLITAFYAAFVTPFQDDSKRTLAYSTLNQLGFMFFGCGSGAYALTLFHLVVHGFYKSFSFLDIGSELHEAEDEQDESDDDQDFEINSNNSSFFNSFNFQNVSISDALSFVAFFSVNALPFTSPDLSKEIMLATGCEETSDFVAYFVTSTIFLASFDEGDCEKEDDIEDDYHYDEQIDGGTNDFFINFSLTALCFCTFFSTNFFEDFFLNSEYYFSAVNYSTTGGEFLCCLPSLFFISEYVFDSAEFDEDNEYSNNPIVSNSDDDYVNLLFSSELWFYEELLARLVSLPTLFLGYKVSNLYMDKGFYSYVGPFGFFNFFYNLSSKFSLLQNGNLTFYIFFSITSIFIIFVFGWGLFMVLFSYYFFGSYIFNFKKTTISGGKLN